MYARETGRMWCTVKYKINYYELIYSLPNNNEKPATTQHYLSKKLRKISKRTNDGNGKFVSSLIYEQIQVINDSQYD